MVTEYTKGIKVVTSLDVYGNINADLTEITTVVNLKDTPLNKPVVPLTEAIKDTVLHQVDGYSSSISSTIKPNFGTDVNTPRYSITADEDATYMAAVQAGDMETAQRMLDASSLS